jgi:hypothetical protein
MIPIMRLLLLALVASGLYGQTVSQDSVTEFMGRKVTITEAETDARGFPKGPATLCLEGPPHRQCFTEPGDFGVGPAATSVELNKGMFALLFSATSPGADGSVDRLALLHPGEGSDLEDLFRGGVPISNFGDYAFWVEPFGSEVPIFVTADYV